MTENMRCAAAGRGCGTPGGWRRGGRCWRCRAAHNAETNRYRGVRAEQRADILAALRAGESVEHAAAVGGISLAMLSQVASDDGELRAAIDGLPVPVQKAARFGVYLAALARTGGEVKLSAYIADVNTGALGSYRQSDPNFAAAEEAVLHWLDNLSSTTSTPITVQRLDQAARVLEQGGTITEAARAINTTATHLRHASGRSPRLTAALPPPSHRGRPAREPTAEEEKSLRELWPNAAHTQREIATQLNISPHLLARWAVRLNLGDRPGRQHRRLRVGRKTRRGVR